MILVIGKYLGFTGFVGDPALGGSKMKKASRRRVSEFRTGRKGFGPWACTVDLM